MQMPKDKGFLKCLKARPGHKLVYTDIRALEPHVLAHFSQDPGLMSLYGPNAKFNDVYLFVASQTSKWGAEIREHYDPYHPTPESISAAKKHCKKARDDFKPVYLGWCYGLGASTMHQTTGIPKDECRTILDDIDKAFPGTKSFGQKLKREWTANGGWVKMEWIEQPDGSVLPNVIDGRPGWFYGGRGRPLSCAPEKSKDLVNRFVQTTGHDVMVDFISLINSQRHLSGMRPWHVDNHDATFWEVAEANVNSAIKTFEFAYEQLNRQLGWTVQISGVVKVGDNMADFLED